MVLYYLRQLASGLRSNLAERLDDGFCTYRDTKLYLPDYPAKSITQSSFRETRSKSRTFRRSEAGDPNAKAGKLTWSSGTVSEADPRGRNWISEGNCRVDDACVVSRTDPHVRLFHPYLTNAPVSLIYVTRRSVNSTTLGIHVEASLPGSLGPSRAGGILIILGAIVGF